MDTSSAYSSLDFKLIMYDVDRDSCSGADCNNDGTVDHGFSSTGVEWWIDGCNTFYENIKSTFPGLAQVGGTIYASGVDGGCNGTQMESMFTGFSGTSYSYNDLSSDMVDAEFRRARMQRGTSLNHILFKQSTLVYDTRGLGVSAKNEPFRMSLGACVMTDMAFHHQALGMPDADLWYDEYAVNLNSSHPTIPYGLARS